MPGMWPLNGGGSGGGGGASVNDTFITATTNGDLPNEVLVGAVILAPGLLSARPAANTVTTGSIYNATDNGILYRSNGTTWDSYVVTASGALLAANNLSDLANAATARTNLGLGGAALLADPITLGHGGTGQTTQQAALDAIAGAVTSAQFLRGDGTHVAMSAIQAADVPTLNQNTTGTAEGLSATLVVGSGGTGLTSAGTAGQQLQSTGSGFAMANEPGFGIFGDGSDGAQTFDGSSVVLGLTPSSNIYTLTRDIYLADGSSLTGSAQIFANNFRVFCSGTLTIGASAAIQCNGNNASGTTGGTFISAEVYGAGAVGGNGAAGASGLVGGATTTALGGSGGAGGASSGGPGTGGGGAGGSATAPSAANGLPRNAPQALLGTISSGLTKYGGGGGGTAGNAAASSTGGGGGGGAGCVGIFALKLVNNGTISANGGTAGAGTGAGTGAGGGGGGGGGGVIIICGPVSTVGTISVAGGSGGAAQGAGKNGANGSSGTSYTITL